MSASTLLLIAFLGLPVLLAGVVRFLYRRHRSATRGRRALLVTANLVSVLALCSLSLACAEIYYRFVYDQSDGFQLAKVGRRWTDRHYRLNNFGMRDNVDYVATPTAQRTRITVVGDSYANGYGLTDVDRRFANLMRKSNPDWEVHVLARDGWDTGPLLADLRRRLTGGYQTDYVVYAYVLNDISDLIDEWQAVARRVYRERHGFLVEHSWAINTYYYRFRVATDPQLAGYFDFLAQAHESDRWDRQRRRLSQLAALVASHDARLLVVTFPFYELMSDARFLAIHAELDAFWAQIGVPHLDLLASYRERPVSTLVVNRFDTHPNAEAHRIAAEGIRRLLRELMEADAEAGQAFAGREDEAVRADD